MSLDFDISGFKHKRILVVGDIMLDEFIHTKHYRNSPEYKDVPIFNILQKKSYLGGAANVALNIKKLGATPYLIGITGIDDASQTIQSLLKENDISNAYLYENNKQNTTKKTRLFHDNKPVCRIDEDTNKSNDTLCNQFILRNIQQAIMQHKPHAIILQDYNKGVLNADTIPAIIALAKQHHLLIAVDPKFDNWNLYKEVDLLKPNLEEFCFMCDSKKEHFNLERNAKVLQEIIKFKILLLTLGADGNFIFDGQYFQTTAIDTPIQNADVCGAGDTVIAVATLALLCNFSLTQTATLSNKAGLIICQKNQVQAISFDELSQ